MKSAVEITSANEIILTEYNNKVHFCPLVVVVTALFSSTLFSWLNTTLILMKVILIIK